MSDTVQAPSAALVDAALAHHRAGRLAAAEQTYRRALEADPGCAGALHMLGVIATQAGRHDEAVDLIRRALAVDPDNAPCHANLAVALTALGRAGEAVESCRRALELAPRYAQAQINLGTALYALERFDEAEGAFRQAIALRPDDAKGQRLLAQALGRQGRWAEAAEALRRAMTFAPGDVDVMLRLGHALLRAGAFGDAARVYRDAIDRAPERSAAHHGLGVALAGRNRLDEAVACQRRAVALADGNAQAHGSLGIALQKQGEVGAAAAAYRRALDLGGPPGLAVRLATLLPTIPESTAAILAARERFAGEVAALAERGVTLADPYAEVGASNFLLAYHGINDRDLLVALARLYLRACPELGWQAPTTPRGDRIRVGVVSRYFKDHAVGHNFLPLIGRLDRARFELVMAPIEGSIDTQALSAADRCIRVPLGLAPARRTLAEAGLDVLVYLDIGMDAFTYFLAFARLAPVQCVLTGHPDTTGIPNLDYFVSSELSEPDDGDLHYSERLARLPGNFLYYARPPAELTLPPREALGFDAADRLYACPQSLFKLHPAFDAMAADILRRDPAGRLVLVEADTPAWTRLLKARLARTMADVAERVAWLPRLDFARFLGLLKAADVVVDTPHFNGATTTRQALALGTPVVSLPGALMRGRVALRHYATMGVDDCLAKDADDYVDIAVRLGADADWRRDVAARIAAASDAIFEDDGAVRAFEDFLESVVAGSRATDQPSGR